MKTQLEIAKSGEISPEMKEVAENELTTPEIIREKISEGKVVITKNNRRNIKPLGIGSGLRTKVNANIGSSMDDASQEKELEKLDIAVRAGADTVMDLSTGGDINGIRRAILKKSIVPLGTVPLYQNACENILNNRSLIDMTGEEMFKTIEQHGQEGVDFITVHCGVTLEAVKRIEGEGRLLNIVSRGGSILAKWMKYHKAENPLYAQFDRLLEIARNYDMTLSLGDGLRPGCLSDATDRAQVQETIILGELAQRAKNADVQVIIEGPGHMPINQITANITLQKRLCHDAPFYVLGPLVTDIAPGYDHITAAIGGAIAATAGADFLCYVTPSEHLRLPELDDIKEGVIASKIAAHAADIAKGVPHAMKKDNLMAEMRKNLDWEKQFSISLDPEKAKKLKNSKNSVDHNACTMCASLCSIKVGNES
jgi:phosphomethylpyrimidine synthase